MCAEIGRPIGGGEQGVQHGGHTRSGLKERLARHFGDLLPFPYMIVVMGVKFRPMVNDVRFRDSALSRRQFFGVCDGFADDS